LMKVTTRAAKKSQAAKRQFDLLPREIGRGYQALAIR